MILLILILLVLGTIVLSTHGLEPYTISLCNTNGRIEPRNETDRKILAKSRRLVKELLDHLQTQKHSKNAREILGWMSPEHVFLFTGSSGGRMKRERKHRRACMFINPDKQDNRIEGRLQSKICHELAHLTGNGHDMKWRDTWKYLLNLSSRDLGWKNHLVCGSCLKYKLCHKKMCPRCTWKAGDHTTCLPLRERGTLLKK